MEKNPNVEEVAVEFRKLVENTDILTALKLTFGGNVKVSLPIIKEFMEEDTSKFDLGTRANGILEKWGNTCGDKTVKGVVKLLEMDVEAKKYMTGYGVTVRSRIQSFFLAQTWNMMSEAQRDDFCYKVIADNTYAHSSVG